MLTPSNKVMKRLSLLIACVGAMSFARADVSSDWVKAGLDDLSSQKTIFIDLAGTYTFGGTTQALRTQLCFKTSFDTDGKRLDRLECADYLDGTLIQRIVGDGTSLWSYDVARNQYSVTTYGSYGKGQPEGYSRKLFQSFMAMAKSQSTYLARLMLDARGYDVAKFTPWIPSATPELTDLTTSVRVRYIDGDPAKRILTFLVSRETAGGNKLTALGFWNTAILNGKQRTTQWLANISTGILIDDSHFVFIPPTGARAVVTPKSG